MIRSMNVVASALAFGLAAVPFSSFAETGPTISASQFNAMLMVDTHLGYTDGTYGLVKTAQGGYTWANAYVKAAADYVDIHTFRDGLTDGTNGSSPVSYYQAVAKSGVSFVLIASGNTQPDLARSLTLIDTLNATTGAVGSVQAIEGSNEINNAPVCWGPTPCISGLSGALSRQYTLQKLVRANTNFPRVQKVVYFTGWGDVAGAPGPDPVTGYADYNNQHPYPNFGQPPYVWLRRNIALTNTANSAQKVMYTETGYAAGPLYGSGCNGGKGGVCWNNNYPWGTKPQVNEAIQAKYTLDIPFDAALLGVDRVGIYELLNGYSEKGQSDSGFGMFHYSATGNLLPKPVATAMANMRAVMRDTGVVAAVTKLQYQVTGLPTHGYCAGFSVSQCTFTPTLALQKSTGQYVIAVWAEQGIWNPDTHVESAGIVYPVSITIPSGFSKVQVFDPYISGSPTATYSYTSTVKVNVVDRPILILLTP